MRFLFSSFRCTKSIEYHSEYNEEVDDYDEPTGSGVDLLEEMRNYLYDIGADEYVEAITYPIYERMTENEGIFASDLEDIVRNTEEANYIIDYQSSTGELLARTYERGVFRRSVGIGNFRASRRCTV